MLRAHINRARNVFVQQTLILINYIQMFQMPYPIALAHSWQFYKILVEERIPRGRGFEKQERIRIPRPRGIPRGKILHVEDLFDKGFFDA